jgi:hypothetical protein
MREIYTAVQNGIAVVNPKVDPTFSLRTSAKRQHRGEATGLHQLIGSQ